MRQTRIKKNTKSDTRVHSEQTRNMKHKAIETRDEHVMRQTDCRLSAAESAFACFVPRLPVADCIAPVLPSHLTTCMSTESHLVDYYHIICVQYTSSSGRPQRDLEIPSFAFLTFPVPFPLLRLSKS